MKRWVLLTVLIGMVAWVMYDTFREQEDSYVIIDQGEEADEDFETGLSPGDQAPNFELETMSGETIRLSDYRGERVILNFWATWCPPCRAEMPDMQEIHEDADADVEIIAVNTTNSETSIENVEEFVDELQLTFPIPLDTSAEVANEYLVQVMPTTYFIDREGRVDRVAYGALNHDLFLQRVEEME
ncbi:peroxiredoxin [Geomicrobium sp. JCM 19055]|uniref:peroxiredoxin family protein n=1 Tax=Geomicrobium sp. JCM 19055 TaxID=1460649 RepID=UPI00045EDA36|nr:redoxin domain-containing protein [Geomicrobium sp. JCM 19055]GAJ97259.1 thiol:disulfide oxidoreductase [Geomicrobium sp. JCM 19055]